MADAGTVDAPVDRDHVEAQRRLTEAVARRVNPRRTQDPAALAGRHRLEALAVRLPTPLLDLDENRRRAIAGDDVDFPAPVTIVAREDDEAQLLEVCAGQVLAAATAGRRDTALYRTRRQRVPFGVSSSTMPSATSLARAASAFWNSRFWRAA